MYGVIGYHVTLTEGHMIADHPIYGVIGYYVTLSEGHVIADPPYKETLVPHLVETLLYLYQNYSYYIRGDRSPLTFNFFRASKSLYCSNSGKLAIQGSLMNIYVWQSIWDHVFSKYVSFYTELHWIR